MSAIYTMYKAKPHRIVASHAVGEPMNVRMWDVPEDFSQEEMRLLAEMCTNGVLSKLEAQACVRQLRE